MRGGEKQTVRLSRYQGRVSRCEPVRNLAVGGGALGGLVLEIIGPEQRGMAGTVLPDTAKNWQEKGPSEGG